MSAPRIDRPIFVVGHPRSGTTLLASMLGRHPDIASTPETLYMTEGQFQLGPSLTVGAKATAARIQRTRLRHLPFSEKDVADELAQIGKLDAPAVFATLLDMFRRRQNKPRVLEKSPVHVRHIDELLTWFPDARILWIVRDGRACVSSLLGVKWASKDPTVLGRGWVRNMAFALGSERRAGRSLMRISYERLVAEPEAAIREAEAFVDVDHDPSVLDHTQNVETVSGFETEWKRNVNDPVSSARAEAWRTELDADTRQRLAVVMNPMLERLGYLGEPIRPLRPIGGLAERARSLLLYNRAGIALMSTAYRRRMWMVEAGWIRDRRA
jgi:hypothetical protein